MNAFLRETEGGVVLLLRVQTRASRAGLLGIQNGKLKWGLRSPPVDGAANEELLASLAEFFGCPRSRITLLRGERHREKQVQIEGLTPAAAEARLNETLPQK